MKAPPPRDREILYLLVLAAFLITPTVALADAGTPLMWAGILHLFVGNAFIGLLEAFVVSRWFPVRPVAVYLLSILGNYFSMISGVAALGFSLDATSRLVLGQEPLYHVIRLLVILVGASYLISIILEWPFFYFGLQKGARTAKRSFQASLLAQSVSYALLIPLYLLPSGFSLYTKAKLTHSLDFVVRKDAMVYFIDTHDSGLYRITLDGSPRQKLQDVTISLPYAHLFTWKANDAASWDLWLLDYSNDLSRTDVRRLLLKNFATNAMPPEYTPRWKPRGGMSPLIFDTNVLTPITNADQIMPYESSMAVDLRAGVNNNWTVRTGFWAIEGLLATNEKDSRSFRLSLEMPFVAWTSKSATILPGNQVVYQLGQQIVVLDLETRKLAFVAIGQSPIVVLP